MLSKPTPAANELEAVKHLTIPVGVIRSDVGMELEKATKAGVGAVYIFTKGVLRPGDIRAYAQGSRVQGSRAGTGVGNVVLGAFQSAWAYGTRLVAGTPLLSASLEKQIRANPWEYAKIAALLDASADVQRDLSKTLEVVNNTCTARMFPVSLLILRQLGGD
eukprot:1432113-Prymnesium_polylepis.1